VIEECDLPILPFGVNLVKAVVIDPGCLFIITNSICFLANPCHIIFEYIAFSAASDIAPA